MKDYKNEFISIFNSILGHNNKYELFSDFLTMSTIAFQNSIFKDDKLEKEYLSIAKKYGTEKSTKIAHLLSCTVLALEENYQDFLGNIYMELEIGNKHSGQFFTPYPICQLMAQITFQKLKYNFIKLHEPASGSGANIIAYYEEMLKQGYNPQQQLFVQAWDVDRLAAMMCYIQLTLLNVPAEIIIGNTLTYEIYKVLHTPAYYLGFWKYKLKHQKKLIQRVRLKSERVRLKPYRVRLIND